MQGGLRFPRQRGTLAGQPHHVIARNGLALVGHAQEIAAVGGGGHGHGARDAQSMYWPPFGAVTTSGSTVTLTVRSSQLAPKGVGQVGGDVLTGWRQHPGHPRCPAADDRRVALAKAMQSLAISFQSAVLPVTARKDFWSRSCPSRLTLAAVQNQYHA
jgi:hypothetical protein